MFGKRPPTPETCFLCGDTTIEPLLAGLYCKNCGIPSTAPTAESRQSSEREDGTPEERLKRHFPRVLQKTDKVLAAAVGSGGAMWLLEDRLVIKHFGLRGMLMQGAFKGELTIFRHAITAITFRESGTVTVGFLQVDYMGSFPLAQPGTGGAASELSSAGTVAFDKADQEQFLQLYDALVTK